MNTKPVRYTSLFALKMDPAVLDLVHEASREAGIKPSQFVRSAIALALQMAGHDTTGGK
jgi:hypothetical protein